jgi:hypothetical protein
MYPKLAWVILHLEYAKLWNRTHSQKTNTKLSLLFQKIHNPKFPHLEIVLV